MRWKKLGIYAGSLCMIALFFSFCYYLSYKNALRQFNKNAVERNNELIRYLEDITENAQGNEAEEEEKQAITVDLTTEDTILPTTKVKLETYDIKTGITTVEIKNPSADFIGLNREEMIELLAYHMSNISLEEYQKGLVSYELISFSKKEVVLRKSFNIDIVQYRYYLAIQNGYVIVYYSDRKTVFEYTSIEAKNLSERDQVELSYGKYVVDEKELYSILEGYSS